MAELQVSILSPAKIVAQTTATQVQVPGREGYLGILPGHTRFITELGVGQLAVDHAGTKDVYFVAGGYLDVAKDKVTVLVDVIEKAGDIDLKRAEEAKNRALDRLNDKAGIDVMRAQAALLRAETRLTLATSYGRR